MLLCPFQIQSLNYNLEDKKNSSRQLNPVDLLCVTQWETEDALLFVEMRSIGKDTRQNSVTVPVYVCLPLLTEQQWKRLQSRVLQLAWHHFCLLAFDRRRGKATHSLVRDKQLLKG